MFRQVQNLKAGGNIYVITLDGIAMGVVIGLVIGFVLGAVGDTHASGSDRPLKSKRGPTQMQ